MSKRRKTRNIGEDVSNILVDQVQSVTGAATAKLSNVRFIYNDLHKKLKVNPYVVHEQNVVINNRVQKIEYGLALLEVMLAFRFIFELFGASYRNVLAAFTYVTTYLFVIPFRGLFPHSSGFSRNELETLAGMLIWAIVAWSSIALIRINKKHSLLYE